MSNSTRYRALRARVASLERQFLPKTFSKTGTYGPDVLDNARAYRVLIHAEIEHYFETRALEIADKAVAAWLKKNKPTKTAMCLLSNISGQKYEGLPKKLGTNQSSGAILGKCFAEYKFNLNRNNGIKTKNLMQLFLPIGIVEKDFDVAWLAGLDTFGTKRGETAHSSHITHQIDPKTERDLVRGILEGIKKFDLLLGALKKSVA